MDGGEQTMHASGGSNNCHCTLKIKQTTFHTNQTNVVKTVLSRRISSLHGRCLSI